jgi:hypothetical protein
LLSFYARSIHSGTASPRAKANAPERRDVLTRLVPGHGQCTVKV